MRCSCSVVDAGLPAGRPAAVAAGPGPSTSRPTTPRPSTASRCVTAKRLFTVVHAPKDPQQDLPGADDPHALWLRPYGVDTPGGLHSPSDEFLKSGYVFVCQDVRGRYMSEGRWVRNAASGSPSSAATPMWTKAAMPTTASRWMLKHLTGHNGRFGVWGCVLPWLLCRCSFDRWPPGAQGQLAPSPINDIWDGDDSYAAAPSYWRRTSASTRASGQPSPTQGEHDGPPFTWTAGDDLQLLPAPRASGLIAALQKDNRYLQGADGARPLRRRLAGRALAPPMKNVKAAVMMVGGWFDAEDLAGPLQAAPRHRALQLSCQSTSSSWALGCMAAGWAGRTSRSAPSTSAAAPVRPSACSCRASSGSTCVMGLPATGGSRHLRDRHQCLAPPN